MFETADPDQLADRIHACLLGGAMGDALGADIEFVSLDETRRRFPQGFDDLPWHDGVRGPYRSSELAGH